MVQWGWDLMGQWGWDLMGQWGGTWDQMVLWVGPWDLMDQWDLTVQIMGPMVQIMGQMGLCPWDPWGDL